MICKWRTNMLQFIHCCHNSVQRNQVKSLTIQQCKCTLLAFKCGLIRPTGEEVNVSQSH